MASRQKWWFDFGVRVFHQALDVEISEDGIYVHPEPSDRDDEARCPDTVMMVNQTLRLKHLEHEIVTLVDGTTREEKAELLRLPLTRLGKKLGARIRGAHAFVSAPLRPEFLTQVKISTECPVAITAEVERQTAQTAIRWSVLYGIYPDEA